MVAVGLAGAPYWRGALYAPGGFKAIPHYWSQAGSWLGAHQGHGDVMLVPGASSADYTWGDRGNEPLSVLSDDSVEWRNLIPLSSTGNIQMLDAVEQTVDSGTPSPGFSQFLARGGVKYVVEQNDLNLSKTGAPPPAVVDQVLSETPGLTRVASFGPELQTQQVQFGTLPVYDSPRHSHLRALEIYRVDPMRSVVSTYPAANPLVVSGDVEAARPGVSSPRGNCGMGRPAQIGSDSMGC